MWTPVIVIYLSFYLSLSFKKSVHGFNTFNHVKNRLNSMTWHLSLCGADNFIQHLSLSLVYILLLECSLQSNSHMSMRYINELLLEITRATSRHESWPIGFLACEKNPWDRPIDRRHYSCAFSISPLPLPLPSSPETEGCMFTLRCSGSWSKKT